MFRNLTPRQMMVLMDVHLFFLLGKDKIWIRVRGQYETKNISDNMLHFVENLNLNQTPKARLETLNHS